MALSTNYNISIANSTSAAPNDGFVDNTPMERYRASGSNPSTYAQCQAKERANVRWTLINQQLELMANCYSYGMTATSATSTTEAAPFVFKVEVERGDTVLQTPDENNAGTVLTGVAAIKRCVARALVATKVGVRDIYDPTLGTTAGNSTQAARYGVRIETLTTGAASANLTTAEGLITVTVL